MIARLWRGGVTALLLCLLVQTAHGAPTDPSPLPRELLELSFEALMEVRVETLVRREQSVLDTPAAVFVLHADEIKRTGVRSIPEALRLVPGLSVARIDASTYSVTARGFSGRIANKLLILVDGRTIYTPLFGGVEWDKELVPIDLVDRIEVVRGPGASLWGANAVNGVINIVTREAQKDGAGEFILGGGTEDRGVAGFRWEDAVGEKGFYRFFLHGQRRDGGESVTGGSASDDWDRLQAGIRFDLDLQNGDDLLVMGDWATNSTAQAYILPQRLPPFQRELEARARFAGGSALLRWTRPRPDGGRLRLQGYFSRYLSDAPDVDQAFTTFDLDYQHDTPWGDGHAVVYGAGIRYVSDHFSGTPYFRITPERDDYFRASAFLESAFSLVPDRLVLTVGSKFEYNEFSGFEVQPRIALRGKIRDRHTLWVAVSRAVRTPSRIEDGSEIWAQTLPFARLVVEGNRELEAEDLHAMEAGYRVQIHDSLALDAVLFYNRYSNLRSQLAARPVPRWFPLPGIDLPLRIGNDADARTYGVEFVLDWCPTSWMRFRGVYSYLDTKLTLPAAGLDMLSAVQEADTPRHQASLHASFSLSSAVTLDTVVRYVGELESRQVDDYVDVDVRLGWHPRPNLEFSIVGQNLLDGAREEFTGDFTPLVGSREERGVYGEVRWRF